MWAELLSTKSDNPVSLRAAVPQTTGEVAMTELPPMSEQEEATQPTRPRRPWSHKFRDALRGLKFGIRGHSSFFVHFFVAALVVVAAVVMECTLTQWCLLSLCIGMVLTAELINSAIETIHRGLDEETKERTWKALDIAAGAVLMASTTAAVVGLLVFAKQLLRSLNLLEH